MRPDRPGRQKEVSSVHTFTSSLLCSFSSQFSVTLQAPPHVAREAFVTQPAGEEVYGALRRGSACESRLPRRQEVDRNYRKPGSYLTRHNSVEDTHTHSVDTFSPHINTLPTHRTAKNRSRQEGSFLHERYRRQPRVDVSGLIICKDPPTKHAGSTAIPGGRSPLL